MISVVIPVKNEEKTIETLVESLLKQSLPPGEIIIVDGGSRDGTIQVLDGLQRSNSSVKIFMLNNAYPGKGRNYGVEQSSGHIVVFLDAGINITNTFIENITLPVREGKAKVVWMFRNDKAVNSMSKTLLRVTFHKKLKRFTAFMAIDKATFIKLGGFANHLRAAEDLEFIERITKANVGEVIVEKSEATYIMDMGSLKEIFLKWFSYASWDVLAGTSTWKVAFTSIGFMGLLMSSLFFPYLIPILYLGRVYLLAIFSYGTKDLSLLMVPVAITVDAARTLGLAHGFIKKVFMTLKGVKEI